PRRQGGIPRRHAALRRLRAPRGRALRRARAARAAAGRARGRARGSALHVLMPRALVLAAGRGERLRPLTDTRPKPLLEAGGKPLIAWQVEALVRGGFRDLVVNHSHLGERIEAALGDGAAYGARIRYSPESPALETAGGVARALPLLGEEPFAVVS